MDHRELLEDRLGVAAKPQAALPPQVGGARVPGGVEPRLSGVDAVQVQFSARTDRDLSLDPDPLPDERAADPRPGQDHRRQLEPAVDHGDIGKTKAFGRHLHPGRHERRTLDHHLGGAGAEQREAVGQRGADSVVAGGEHHDSGPGQGVIEPGERPVAAAVSTARGRVHIAGAGGRVRKSAPRALGQGLAGRLAWGLKPPDRAGEGRRRGAPARSWLRPVLGAGAKLEAGEGRGGGRVDGAELGARGVALERASQHPVAAFIGASIEQGQPERVQPRGNGVERAPPALGHGQAEQELGRREQTTARHERDGSRLHLPFGEVSRPRQEDHVRAVGGSKGGQRLEGSNRHRADLQLVEASDHQQGGAAVDRRGLGEDLGGARGQSGDPNRGAHP